MTYESNICPQRVAESFSGMSIDDLVAINSVIATMIDKRLVNLKMQAKKGATAAVAGLTKTATVDHSPAPKLGKIDLSDLKRAFADFDPRQINQAASSLHRFADEKRKERQAA